jgi:hypothetical protein
LEQFQYPTEVSHDILKYTSGENNNYCIKLILTFLIISFPVLFLQKYTI